MCDFFLNLDIEGLFGSGSLKKFITSLFVKENNFNTHTYIYTDT